MKRVCHRFVCSYQAGKRRKMTIFGLLLKQVVFMRQLGKEQKFSLNPNHQIKLSLPEFLISKLCNWPHGFVKGLK